MLRFIRRIPGLTRFLLVRILARKLERVFYAPNGVGGWERFVISLFARLNSESYTIRYDHDVLLRYDDGNVFYLASRRSNLDREIARSGAFYLVDWASSAIKDGEVVLDVGANTGVFALALAKRHPNAELHCFEPHPGIYPRLERNCAINRLSNLHIVQMAVSNSCCRVNFFAQDLSKADNWGLSSVVYSPDIGECVEISVEATTVDEYASKHLGGLRIGFIKIDVQGEEINVLRGASEVMKRDRPVIVFEHEDVFFEDSVTAKSTLRKLLEEHHYAVFSLSKRFPNMCFPVDWDGTIEVDLIAFPDSITRD